MNETEVIKSLLAALEGWMDQPDTAEAYALAHDRAMLAVAQAQEYLKQAPSVDDDDLARLTRRGAAAWKDVPDATAWVDELRGKKQAAPAQATFVIKEQS